MIPLYFGTIQEGKLHLTRNEKALFRDYLATLEGKEVQVAVEERKYTRTLPQNNWYWAAVVQIPADHFGYTKEEMHAVYGQMFRKAEKVIADKIYEYVRSTTTMTTAEFSDYCEKCRMWAAGEGIVIPDPSMVQ